jgi:hypothetical protein
MGFMLFILRSKLVFFTPLDCLLIDLEIGEISLTEMSSALGFMDSPRLRGETSSMMPSMTFLAVSVEAGSSPFSSELQPSESFSSSLASLAYSLASAAASLRRLLLSMSFFISQKAYRTEVPTFWRSPILKCYPFNYPILAPAKDASRVKTKGILSL